MRQHKIPKSVENLEGAVMMRCPQFPSPSSVSIDSDYCVISWSKDLRLTTVILCDEEVVILIPGARFELPPNFTKVAESLIQVWLQQS